MNILKAIKKLDIKSNSILIFDRKVFSGEREEISRTMKKLEEIDGTPKVAIIAPIDSIKTIEDVKNYIKQI